MTPAPSTTEKIKWNEICPGDIIYFPEEELYELVLTWPSPHKFYYSFIKTYSMRAKDTLIHYLFDTNVNYRGSNIPIYVFKIIRNGIKFEYDRYGSFEDYQK